MVDHVNAKLRDVPQRPPGGYCPRDRATQRTSKTGYVMSFVGSEIPISSALRPTLLLGQKTLVLASTPAMARRAGANLAENQAGTIVQAGPGAGNPLGTGSPGCLRS